MKIAILSDVHANLEALTVALKTIDTHGADAIYCLGDIVGYGADAAACVDLIRDRCTAAVRGNHDEAVALDRGVAMLPKDAQAAALHNRAQLDDDQLAYLAELPLTLEAHGCTFVHATPEKPAAWLRLDSYVVTQQQFKYFDTGICFVGHTHIPAVMGDKLGVLRVRAGNRFLINVGSVGQPRDQNPRLAVAFFDTEAFAYELVREPYNVERTVTRILEAGLPPGLHSVSSRADSGPLIDSASLRRTPRPSLRRPSLRRM